MISVVIPAFNEENYLPFCLDSIVKQKTNKKFEVIVVNNNSTDNTKKIALRYRKKINIRVIDENKKGRGSARFSGFNAAKGDIILSTDADTILPENWVEVISNQLKKYSAVSGLCTMNDRNFIENALFNFGQPVAMIIYRIRYGHFWLNGFNFGIKKKQYISSGGFNKTLNSIEDIDLSFRVAKICKIKLVNLKVKFCGRRFRKGIFSGSLEYFKEFRKYRKNLKPIMDDPR